MIGRSKRTAARLSTTQIIMLSFLLTIFLGSALLSLPFSAASGVPIPYIDALFTATTATCVTGLVTLPTVSTFSVFGQAVILLLIQIGGLGVITVMAGLMIALHRRLGLRDSRLIGDAFNITSLSGLRTFVKRVIVGALTVEALGALLYMIVFIPDFGARGIWISVFNSVSAFCNAGIDIVSENSLCAYATNPLVNAVTSLLVILGGLGYIVWWDIFRVLRERRARGLACFKRLTLHSKVVLSTTAVLILGGALAILLLEYKNPLTLGHRSFFDKIQIALFQSVTTRTAGFATVPQEDLTAASSIVSLLLMFIGGSPVGTAGGIKTVTAAVLLATALATVRNKNEVCLFNRRLSREAVRKAVAVTLMSFATLLLSSVLLAAGTNADPLSVIYESVSATATVGLSRNLTPYLDLFGKAVIILTMYLGRVGPISIALLFSRGGGTNLINDPTEEISVG